MFCFIPSGKRVLTLVFGALFAVVSHAQSSFWTDVSNSRPDAPTVEVKTYRTWQLDVEQIESWLNQAPVGKAFEARSSGLILDFPMPDGSLERFKVVYSPIMAKDLAVRFPEIKVYAGQGVDHPEATVRFDLTPQGFHAMILAEGQTIYIDPYHPGERNTVISYTRSAFYATTSKQSEGCMALELPESRPKVTEESIGGKPVKTMG